MLWINFLHFYQPPDAEDKTIEEATAKSYRRVIRTLLENQRVKFTINITGCLALRWQELEYYDLINQIKELIARGQIELTGSAAYHPIIPLIEKKEAIHQIKENEKILNDIFGVKPVGFFPPEMAFHRGWAKIIKRLGYQWVILDEISSGHKLGTLDRSKNYQDYHSGLKIFFRDRRQSHTFVPDLIFEDIRKSRPEKEYLTATDGELYGLRHIDQKEEFEKLLKEEGLTTQTISEYLSTEREISKIKIISASWESTPEEIRTGQPFFLWRAKKNKIQKKLWRLAHFAYRITEKHRYDENYSWGRWHLTRGMASCGFWWASQKDFSHIFGPLAWNPDEINKKAEDLVKAVRSFEDHTSLRTKIKAEKMAGKIKDLVWKKHWEMKHKE